MDGGFNTDDIEELNAISTTQLSNLSISNDDTLSAIKRTQAIGIIDFNNGLFKTTATHIHIVKRNGLWTAREANGIVLGDFFYHIELGEIEITSKVEDSTNTYTVYKLDVEPNDTYFANGLLTHNRKEALCGPDEVCDPGSICYDPCSPDAGPCAPFCGGFE